MFGFLRLNSCSLTPEDKRLYGGHFCSACHAMTEFGGRISSLLTNYDITFWLLLQSALDTKPVEPLRQLPCTAVPFRKVSVKPLRPEVAQTMAALNLLLVGSKVEDDAQDGQRWKALAARSLYHKKFTKAEKFLVENKFTISAITSLAQSQEQAEAAELATLDSLAFPTASALGEVFASIAQLHQQPHLRTPLREFGENLGGFLYLWDALVDLSDDERDGQFNAISKTCPAGINDPKVRQAFTSRLQALRKGLNSLALGPEGTLCQGLLTSLEKRLNERLPRPTAQLPSPRHRLTQAGFVRTSDCCELDCCECGSCCDCNVCDCNPCNDNDQCCNVNCCDCGLCCCTDSSSGCGRSGRRSSGCFDSYCLENLCCGHFSPTGGATVSHTTTISNEGFMARYERAKKGRNLPATVGGDSSRTCPRCVLPMVSLQVGSIVVEECRNCGGIWLDDKEVDELAKLPSLPHNLLNRYPTQEASAQHLPGDCSCPVCPDAALVAVPYLGIPVEMCRTCHGFWLEHGVLDRVLKAKRSPKRLLKSHKQEWRCPYCQKVAAGGLDVCQSCGAPRPKTGFTGKLG